jgi:hypothetical protein
MERQDIDDQLSTTGAKELLASTSAAHLAYIAKDANTTGDSSRLFLDRRPGRDLLGHVITEVHPNVGGCIWRSTSLTGVDL